MLSTGLEQKVSSRVNPRLSTGQTCFAARTVRPKVVVAAVVVAADVDVVVLVLVVVVVVAVAVVVVTVVSWSRFVVVVIMFVVFCFVRCMWFVVPSLPLVVAWLLLVEAAAAAMMAD